VIVQFQRVRMRDELIFHAMKEEDWASRILDSIDVSEPFVYQRGNHEAKFPKEASRYILN